MKAPTTRVATDAAVADLADLADLVALERAAMGAEAWSESQVAEELAAPGRVVVTVGGTPALLGWIDLAVAGDTADLLRVAVHPDARRTGVARRLLDAGVAELPDQVERVLLEVAEHNVAARALYASYGFVEVGRRRRYYRDGTDALVMVRPVVRGRGGDA